MAISKESRLIMRMRLTTFLAILYLMCSALGTAIFIERILNLKAISVLLSLDRFGLPVTKIIGTDMHGKYYTWYIFAAVAGGLIGSAALLIAMAVKRLFCLPITTQACLMATSARKF